MVTMISCSSMDDKLISSSAFVKFTALSLYIFFALCNQVNAQDVRGRFECFFVDPEQIIRKGDGHYFIDFGKDAFGTLSLTFKATQHDSITIHLGEKLSENHTVDRNPGGTVRYQKIVQGQNALNTQLDVKLPADKRNSRAPAVLLPDSFGVIMPFRYAEIQNLSVPISDVVIRQKVYTYQFNDDASSFISSDTVLDQVWELCKHTIKATSFCGLYVDGDRERIPYEADAFINQLSHYAVDSEYSMARNTNEYFIDHPTWPTEWILHTVPLFYYDYLYTGDLDAIKKHYDALKHKTLIALAREDGLISTKSDLSTDALMRDLGFADGRKRINDIVDWPEKERDGYEMVDVNTVVNSFHFMNLTLMAEVAGLLDKVEDSILFSRRSLEVKRSINQKLFDKSKGVYVDGEGSVHSSLHGNLFPLVFGLVPEEHVGSVVLFIKSRGMACSVYGAQYLLEALYKYGEADYALQLMTETHGDRNWWNMIRAGSTMTLEAWDHKYKPNLDWNHAWATAPVNIASRYLWGITPGTPGFGKVHIQPQTGRLTFSKIKAPTIHGPIYAEFKSLQKNRKLFRIELPADMTGDFVLPPGARLLVNSRVQKVNKGSVPLYPGINQIEIQTK
jgi:alpha-L-rhamnosidase